MPRPALLREVGPGSIVVTALIAVLLACGGGGNGGGTGGTAGGAPDGGGGTGGTAGGAPDGGAGSVDGGGVTATGADGGSGGGSTGGGGTGGTGAGPAPAPFTCADALPTFGAAVERAFDTGSHVGCGSATSNANGSVALGFSTTNGLTFDLYSAAGVSLGAALSQIYPPPGALLDTGFHPAGAAWHGIVHDAVPPLALWAWDAAGQVASRGERVALSSAPTADGSVLISQEWNSGAVGATHLDWLDTSGRVTQTVLLDVVPSALIQAWDTGHVLVVATRVSPWRARWYGADAAPLTGFFDVPGSANGTAILKLLVDGRVAVSDGGSWVGVIADGSITFEAPPGWLATRPSTVLATIRGGRAYAVHSSLFGTASDEVEILLGSGESCGQVTLPAPVPPAGQQWTPSGLDVGYDGTVFQRVNRSGSSLGSGVHCAFRWWSGVLK